MSMKTKSSMISRRRFVGGSLAGSAVLMGAGVPVFASAKARASGLSTGGVDGRCHLRHAAMAEELSRTIADPAVDAAATALAIRTSHCSCCGTQIGAASGFVATGIAA